MSDDDTKRIRELMDAQERRRKRQVTAQIVVALIIAVPFASCVVWCASVFDTHHSPAEKAAIAERDRAAEEAAIAADAKRNAEHPNESGEEDARELAIVSKMKALVCTKAADRAGPLAATKWGRTIWGTPTVYVDMPTWELMNFDTRTGFSAWAALCHLDVQRIVLLNGNTGQEIGTFSVSSGYESSE